MAEVSNAVPELVVSGYYISSSATSEFSIYIIMILSFVLCLNLIISLLIKYYVTKFYVFYGGK